MPRAQRASRWLGAALALLPGLASAHARFDVRVEIGAPQIPGVIVELHQDLLAPQLVIENRSGKPLEVLDAEGRPFLRIGPRDASADVAAAAFHLSRISGGAVPPAGTLSPTPRWRTVSKAPSYGWFDPRIAVAGIEIPPGIQAAGREGGQPLPLGEWRIPLRVDGKPAQLAGVFVHTPPPRGGIKTFLLPGALGAGIEVQLAPGRLPALRLANRGAQPVEVLDAQGQPFLRIGADGAWGNLDRPALRAAASGRLPEGKKGWQRLSPSPAYVWLEARAAYTGAPPKDGKPQRLGGWSVPLRIGKREVLLRGAHEWIPAPVPKPRS